MVIEGQREDLGEIDYAEDSDDERSSDSAANVIFSGSASKVDVIDLCNDEDDEDDEDDEGESMQHRNHQSSLPGEGEAEDGMPANASKRLPHLPANLSVPDATSHKGSDFAWDNEHLEHFASLSVFELLSGKVHPDDLCGTLMLRIAPHVVHNELWRRFNALYERLNLRTISTHAVSKRWQKALEFLHPDKAEYDAKCKEIRDARTKLRAHGFKAQDKPPSGGCNDGRRSRQQEERAKNKAREKTVPPTASGVSKATTTSSKQSASSKTLPSASPEVGNASTAARDLQPPTKRAKTQKAPEAQLAGGDVETRTTSPTQPRSTAHRLQLPGSQATPMAFTIPGLQGANKQNDPEVQKLNDDEELPQYQPKNTPDLSARDQARIAVLQAEIFERMEEVGRLQAGSA